MMTKESRFKGCLLGLAVGDAVGTTLEFARPGSFKPIKDMVGGGPFNLKPGQWTDDTSMALCSAISLVEKMSFDVEDQMKRFVQWWHKGYMSSTGRCFDIGGTVAIAIGNYIRKGVVFAGSEKTSDSGNGSLMRLAPFVMGTAFSTNSLVDLYCRWSSKMTHGSAECLDCCSFYGNIMRQALLGKTKDEILDVRLKGIVNSPKVKKIIGGSYKEKQPPKTKGTGYVVDSMEAALWAFYTTDNFKDGCLAAANLGDDADTTAAIYGQFAGAFYGDTGIPKKWLGKLYNRSLIEILSIGLLEIAESGCLTGKEVRK